MESKRLSGSLHFEDRFMCFYLLGVLAKVC